MELLALGVIFLTCVTVIAGVTCIWTNWNIELLRKGFNLFMSETKNANTKAIEDITAQLVKARGEIVARIDSLQQAVDRGDDISGPLGDLRKVAQALDDLVDDDEGGLETNGPATPDETTESGAPTDNVSDEEAQVVVDGDNRADQKGKNTTQPEEVGGVEANEEAAEVRAKKA